MIAAGWLGFKDNLKVVRVPGVPRRDVSLCYSYCPTCQAVTRNESNQYILGRERRGKWNITLFLKEERNATLNQPLCFMWGSNQTVSCSYLCSKPRRCTAAPNVIRASLHSLHLRAPIINEHLLELFLAIRVPLQPFDARMLATMIDMPHFAIPG